MWVHCACYGCYAMQSTVRMDGLLYIGWLQVLLAALILFWWAAGRHTHTFSHTQRNGGHAGTVGGGGG